MSLRKPLFGPAAQARRQAKRDERARIQRELYGYRPSLDDRLAWGDLQPHSPEAESVGLPIFNKGRELAEHPADMEWLARAGGAFLRAVRIVPPQGYSATVAETAILGDKHLNAIAKECGAQVVSHAFGLYDARGRTTRRHYQPDIIPEGYMFAAEVASAPSLSTVESAKHISQIEAGLTSYRDAHPSLCLTDLHLDQFRVSEGTLLLLDIDLIFRDPQESIS